ncbi:MAG: thioredoxin domain-containing protein [Myxococcota bacterium]|nr:thioredoxin domain-containing protein [Myxococcota bacterium]
MSEPNQPPNRLAREKSAYLRQHQHNPVDWYPWGEEALARARTEDRPILLSVGYSACHWCHVMAHESFEDPATARLMNSLFINIKVDREERPDVDQLYQGVVQLMGRGGGWPLTVFLTPQLRPFFGGTYFPPEDRHGLMAFPRLLQALHDAYRERRTEVEEQASELLGGLEQISTYGLTAQPGEPTSAHVVEVAQQLAAEVDPVHGGFGLRGPKFPNPMNVQLLLRGDRRAPDPRLRQAAMRTLEKMARGGIYDQLGGGFHRYSVDERWAVPHFEKMLYDNGQLLHLYSEAFQVEPRPLFRRIVEETVEYVHREMTSPEGAFYASQDADSEGEEGKFFVWTPQEVDRLLTPEQSRLARLRWNITPGGNFEHGATVLKASLQIGELAAQSQRSEAEIREQLAQLRRTLFEAREQRIKPDRDEKLLAGWNGLMIRGLAQASRVFHRPDWAELAQRSADFLLDQLWDGQRLLRLYQQGPGAIEGFAEDYGALAAGLVALYQATFEARYLTAAEGLLSRADALFWDEEKEAFLSAPRGQKDLVTAPYALHDSASPSGASSLTEAQIALAALTGKPERMRTATRYLRRLSEPMRKSPMAFGHLWLAADAYVDGAAELTLVGDVQGRDALLDALRGVYAPTVAVAAHQPGTELPAVLEETFRDRTPVRGAAAGYLCRQFTCQLPQTDPTKLAEAVRAVK